ncbi:MAG: hypothetical protein LBI04_12285 [Treponema sp.]|jgi:uncharacterized membrane protein|nr:hypothetical protein [Treponema sp.]
MDNNELLHSAREIPSVSLEEDSPKMDQPLPRARLEELKAEREEARRDADADHARKRDTWVTFSGLILVFMLILIYWFTSFLLKPNDYLASFLYLLNSVVMLVLGYIFTKITQR